MTALTKQLGIWAGALVDAFDFSSNEETAHEIKLKELSKAQFQHDMYALRIGDCVDPEKQHFLGPKDLLEHCALFLESFDTPFSKVASGVQVPIQHKKSFEVFYRLQQAGYKPIAPDETNLDESSAGILKYTVGRVMYDLQKYGGMDTIDYDRDKLKETAAFIGTNLSHYDRQRAVENPHPDPPKA